MALLFGRAVRFRESLRLLAAHASGRADDLELANALHEEQQDVQRAWEGRTAGDGVRRLAAFLQPRQDVLLAAWIADQVLLRALDLADYPHAGSLLLGRTLAWTRLARRVLPGFDPEGRIRARLFRVLTRRLEDLALDPEVELAPAATPPAPALRDGHFDHPLYVEAQDRLVWPGLVLGWEADEGPGSWGVTEAGDAPPWLHWIEHQGGGLGLRRAWVMGAVFPLADNLQRGGAEVARIHLGAYAMADDPKPWILDRGFGPLEACVPTNGGDFTAPQRRRLASWIAPALPRPAPVTSGFEAFLRLGSDLGVDDLLGWRALSAWEVPLPPDRVDSDPDPDPDLSLALALHPFGADDARTLAAWGRRRGLTRAPRAFLLWTNSDLPRS